MLDYRIDPVREVVIWLLEMPNGDQLPMEFKIADFGKSMNITIGDPPEPQIIEFSNKRLGKPLNILRKKGLPNDGKNIRQS